MSNKKGNEMTNKIDIDLASIPHPKDCYPVPAGATIPPYTPCWIVRKHGLVEWVPNGHPGETIVGSNAALYLTICPISASPTPDDSPIIINHHQSVNGIRVATNRLAIYVDHDDSWMLVDDSGRDLRLDSDEITDWSPAIVTKSGRGVWDERDKRDRVDADGDTWCWHDDRAVWACSTINTARSGSLKALSMYYGGDYLIGFADEKGGEE